MAKFVVVVDGVVKNIIRADSQLDPTWVEVPSSTAVSKGDTYDGTTFTRTATEEAQAAARRVNIWDFWGLFQQSERVAIRALVPGDGIVDDFMKIVKDPRVNKIDTQDKIVTDFLKHLVTLTVITNARRKKIEAGEPA